MIWFNMLNVYFKAVPEFDLPNEEQISYYEQLMMMSNETIVLSNFLENQNIQVSTFIKISC